MKKFLFKSIGVLMAFVLVISQTQALSARTIDLGLPAVDESVFVLDQSSLNSAMQELNQLESYLDQNEGLTYADLQAAGSNLILNVSDSSNPMGMNGGNDDLLGIPPFLWGCVLSWVGVLLVYLMTDGDKPSVKKAVVGALITTGVIIVFYVVYFVIIAAADASIN